MTRECAVEKVYEEFRSFSDGLPRKALDGLLIEDGVRMQYWADVGTSLAAEVDANAMGPGDVTRLDGILDPNPTSPNLNGIGTCGAWQALFMACLQVHGVPRAPYRLVPDDGGLHPVLVRSLFSTTGLIVKDHAFGDALVEPLCTRPDVFEGIELLPLVFTHLEVDCATGAPSLGQSCDGPGVMGQNRGTSANPRSIFWEHAMVCYAGRLYDPSYGTADVAYPFTESQLRDWEHERLAGYFTHECPGAGRSTTEEAAARNETAFGVIPP